MPFPTSLPCLFHTNFTRCPARSVVIFLFSAPLLPRVGRQRPRCCHALEPDAAAVEIIRPFRRTSCGGRASVWDHCASSSSSYWNHGVLRVCVTLLLDGLFLPTGFEYRAVFDGIRNIDSNSRSVRNYPFLLRRSFFLVCGRGGGNLRFWKPTGQRV